MTVIESNLRESTFMPLPINIWNQVIQSGIFFDFSDNLQRLLLNLYAKVNNRNNLWETQQMKEGELVLFSDAGLQPVREVLVDVRRQIEFITGRIRPLLDELIDVRRERTRAGLQPL